MDDLPPPRLGDRTLFPDLEARAYLSHAGISPPSVVVRRAVDSILEDYARRGLGAFLDWHEKRDGLRASIATFIGARTEDVGFVANTTRGVGIVAECFPWKRGDRIVLLEGEFPANVTPWQQAAAREGLEIEFIPVESFRPDEDEGLQRLERALRQGARLLAVSAVQFQSGLRMPLEQMAELCHAHDAQIFVDGIQGVGAVPMDVRALGIDYMSCGSHKWLMGLEGCAFLYVHPDRVSALRPYAAGWLSHDDAVSFLLEGPGHLRYDRPIKQSASFVEGGAYNAVGLVSLEASLGLIHELGVEAIFAHLSTYLDRLETGLVQRGFTSLRPREVAGRSGILGVRPPHDVDVIPLHDGLEEQGIACSIPDGILRFAPHWPNALDEVDVVLAAVDVALRRPPRS